MHLRRWILLATVALCALLAVPGVSVPATAAGSSPGAGAREPKGATGEWPLARKDTRNSGHQEMPGEIRRPGVLSRAYLGGTTGWVMAADLDGSAGDELLHLTAGRVVASSADLTERWSAPGLKPADLLGVHDLDADGDKEVVGIGSTTLFVLDGGDGRLLWQRDFGAVMVNDSIKIADLDGARRGLEIIVWPYNSQHGIAIAFDRGAADAYELWRTSPAYENPAYLPEVVIGDLDADGGNEVLIAGYGSLRAYDGASGSERSGGPGWNGRADWIAGPGVDGRNYGQVELINLDDDPHLEIVVVADGVTLHVAVVDNDATGLSLRYDKFIDHPEHAKTLRTTVNGAGDLDADGRVELAVSIYNDTGDERWHTLVVDALSGFATPELDLVDAYLRGVRDLDGDGRAELLVSREPQRTPTLDATIEVYAYAESAGYGKAWSLDRARFALDPHVLPPPAVSPHSRNFMTEVLDAGPLASLVAIKDGNLVGYTFSGGVMSETWRRQGADGVLHRAGDLDRDGTGEVVFQTPGGTLRLERPDGSLVRETTLGGMAADPTVADLDGDGRNEVLVPAAGSVRVFDSRKGRLTERWRAPGQGVFVYLGGRQAVPAADLDGDGDKEVVLADAFEEHSRLRVLDAEGDQVWAHVFEDLPAPSPGNGVYTWTFGHFNRDAVLDVYVAAFTGGYNTEVSRMLDGASGALLSARNGNPERPGIGFGPWVGHVGIDDLNGDGLDDAVFLAKDVTYAINGSDLANPRVVRGHQGLYHNPTFIDLDGDGRDELAMTGGFNYLDVVTFATNPSGSTVWSQQPADGSLLGRLSGIADVDADGTVELATYALDGTFVSRDARTGATEWQVRLPADGASITTVDVDGNGRADYVAGTTNGELLALDGRADAADHILWRLDLGYAIGDVTAADVDRDRRSELLFVAEDGYLYVVDQRRDGTGG